MSNPLLEANLTLTKLEGVYRRAAGKWTGCDWRTEFGQRCLDLNGLRAAQVILMARATAGEEAVAWHAAADWLTLVEEDAKTAEDEARSAVTLAASGDMRLALEHAQRACALELRYHTDTVWEPLRAAIQAKAAVPAVPSVADAQ